MKKKLTPILKNYLIERITSENNIEKFKEEDILKLFNINSIPYEERKKQHIDFSFYVHGAGYGSPVMIGEGEVLTEDAEHTRPFEEVYDEVIRLFKLQNWQIKEFKKSVHANNISIAVLIANINMNIQLTCELFKVYGWSIASYNIIQDEDNLDWVALSFDPMFQDDITDEVKKYTMIYHITPRYNQELIQKNGLIPKSENYKLMYPNRLHFIKGSADESIIYNFGWQLCRWNKRIENDGNYVLFGVNPQELPDSIRFYYDPRFEYGYYTKQSVEPKYIKLIGEVNFKTDNNITFFNNF